MIYNKLLLVLFFFVFKTSLSQNAYSKILWDKDCNCPVEYATVSSNGSNVLSNESGFFNISTTNPMVSIESISYYPLTTNLQNILIKDTIYLLPKISKLDELYIEKNSLLKEMLNTILTDYNLEPHIENFFLRAVLKKNDKLYKIVDLSGKVKKKTLFNTKSKPMPKSNYEVQLENFRKVGLIDNDYEFTIINLEDFFNLHNNFYINSTNFDIKYNSDLDEKYTLIKAVEKNNDTSINKTVNFLVNNFSKNFEKASMQVDYDRNFSVINKNIKSRTNKIFVESTFNKNKNVNKLQINYSIIKIQAEVVSGNKIDKFDLNFFYYSYPAIDFSIKNNVNHKKDIFDLNYKYNDDYWKTNEILPLTNEMQDFINMVNLTSKNSDFKTKTNIK